MVEIETTLSALPQGWIIVPLSEVVDKITDGSHNPPPKQDSGKPMLSARNIENNRIVFNEFRLLSEEAFEIENRRTQVSPGDVLLTIVGTIGRAAVVPENYEPFTLQRSVAVLSPSVTTSKFLMYQLQSPNVQSFFKETAKGTAQKGIYLQALGQTGILVPPLSEQNRVVARIEELFSELDKGIEYLRTAQAQLKVYRQSVLKYAFEGKLTEQWREFHISKLETADQLLERIQQEGESRYQQQLNKWEEVFKVWEENGKEGKKPGKPQMPFNTSSLTEEELVNLPDLPESWCWIKLSVLSERIQIGPFGSLLHRSDYVSNQVPIVNPVHIRNQKIEPDWSLTVTEEKVNELSNYIMYPGDIVMGRRGEMGRCAVISHKESGFICGSGSLFIRLLPSINPLFYCYLLGSQRLKNYLSDQSVGTTMQNLNQEIIHNLPVPLCSPIEIQKIIEEVDRRTTLITEVENIIEKNLLASEILKQSILKNAFSGQLVPQGSGDENAAVLLERIREARRHQEDHQVPVPKPKKKVAMKKDLSIIG